MAVLVAVGLVVVADLAVTQWRKMARLGGKEKRE
jgi:hypothetical protein